MSQKYYRVPVTYTVDVNYEVFAESEEEAIKIVEDNKSCGLATKMHSINSNKVDLESVNTKKVVRAKNVKTWKGGEYV